MRAALAVACLLTAVLAVLAPAANAQPKSGPVDVRVTISVVGFGNYDAKQGTYVLDFYLVLAWDTTKAPENFTAAGFEFANGRATSQTLQYDATDDNGTRSLYYRVQANLYSAPRYDAYPFDKQVVEVALEDAVYPASQLRYVADPVSGYEDSFEPAGWELKGSTMDVSVHDLSFDEPYSQARLTIVLQRSVLSGVLKVLLPPLAFLAISAVAFFLRGADKVATRFSLAANMAISGIMFHAAQSATLPSLSRIIFLDRYMLAIHVFTFGSVAVTALVALAEMKAKDHPKAERINLRGAIAVAAACVGTFLLLQFV